MLNRMQVKLTRNSKKIRRIGGNKSDSPHLRGKSCCCRRFASGWSMKERKLKLQSETQLGRAYICTPDGHLQPGPWTDAEGFFFSGTGHVYPHLDKTPGNQRRHRHRHCPGATAAASRWAIAAGPSRQPPALSLPHRARCGTFAFRAG